MGTGQHEGVALLIVGVFTLAQSIGLAQLFLAQLFFTPSTSKITAWNIQ